MNLTDDIRPVSFFKSHTADMLKQVNETHRPVIITQNGEARAVLQDPRSYENMKNAFGILKLIAQGEEDIRKGNLISPNEVFDNIEKLLSEK